MNRLRIPNFLSGVLGGLVVLVAGAVLIATDVIDTGDTVNEVVQSPITEPAADRGDGEGLTVSEIYDRDGPGVVFIEARGVSGDSPFGTPNEGRATGSGFVLEDEGFILTNAHVVEGADDIGIRFGEGSTVEAELVGTDPSTDLAVLKVDPDEAELRPLRLGDSSEVDVGDPTIAIGNPFGLDRTVTTGIVSAIQRTIEAPNGFSIDNAIQTDASINPGNSGGPLLDATGRVIGINSQIATGGGGGSVGIGFAVPINTAKAVIPQLKEDGEVQRAYLGVSTLTVDERTAEDLNLPAQAGALVQRVFDGGPADEAGLRAGRTPTADGVTAGGDLIVKVDGVEIGESSDVAAAIADNKPGDEIEIEFFRGDDREKVTVELGERPEETPSQGGPDGGRPSPPDEPDDQGPELFPFP
ncbi:MAG: trypsin-like peptidase domain-containing protein [Thermoleophilaceae bacterium]